MQYLEGFREQDLSKMISAYSVETCIDRIDMKAALERIGAYAPNMIPIMPNSGGMLREINIEVRKNQIIRTILWQMTSICLPGLDFTQIIPISRDDESDPAAAFVEGIEEAFKAVDFGTLTLLQFTPPEQISEFYMSERNQQNLKAQVAPYGGEEIRSVIALFMVDEQFCALACDAIRYGDRWYMHQPYSNIAVLAGVNMPNGILSVPKENLVQIMGELDAPLRDMIADVFKLN